MKAVVASCKFDFGLRSQREQPAMNRRGRVDCRLAFGVVRLVRYDEEQKSGALQISQRPEYPGSSSKAPAVSGDSY
jgi:hypothetical protein